MIFIFGEREEYKAIILSFWRTRAMHKPQGLYNARAIQKYSVVFLYFYRFL